MTAPIMPRRSGVGDAERSSCVDCAGLVTLKLRSASCRPNRYIEYV